MGCACPGLTPAGYTIPPLRGSRGLRLPAVFAGVPAPLNTTRKTTFRAESSRGRTETV
jgi:hypothetical protein